MRELDDWLQAESEMTQSKTKAVGARSDTTSGHDPLGTRRRFAQMRPSVFKLRRCRVKFDASAISLFI